MERTVIVWIGNDGMEIDFEDNESLNEDEFYEAVVNYVYDNISVEII